MALPLFSKHPNGPGNFITIISRSAHEALPYLWFVIIIIFLYCLCYIIPFIQWPLTHSGRDKMATILQTTFPHAFSGVKMYEFCPRFQRILFLRFWLTIFMLIRIWKYKCFHQLKRYTDITRCNKLKVCLIYWRIQVPFICKYCVPDCTRYSYDDSRIRRRIGPSNGEAYILLVDT